MANRYSKALKHIRGKKNLSEAPTNSLSGVYALNKPGTRLGPPPKDGKIFLPDIDGNYPPGIPGTPGEPFYKRGDGYWSGEVDWDTITTPSFANADAGSSGTDTTSLIDDATGVVLTGLPPNSRHFILGPLVDGYVYNHGSDAFTNIGYIQKDTRQFVLLARVNGQWVDNLSTFETYGWGIGRTWDGLEPSFYAYNPEFTYEMAKWYQKEVAEGRYVNNVAYFYSGGVGQPGLGGNAPAPGMYGGTGVGAGGDGSEANSTGSGFGYGSGGEPTIGTAENETPGGPEDAGFPWGLGQLWDDLKDKAGELWDNLKDKAGDLVDDVGEFLGDVFDNAQDMAEGAADLVDSLGDAIADAAENVGDAVGDAFGSAADAVGDAFGSAADAVGDAFDAASKIPEKAGEAWNWYKDNQEAVNAAAGSVMNAVDAAMAIASVVGVIFPEVGTSAAGALGIASLANKMKKAYNAVKAGKSVADVIGGKNKGLSGAGSFDVGATGVKKGGFDALNPNQVGPKAQHTGSKGILSPGGGMVYSAPKVGQTGPSAINPGSGASKYTQYGSNPFSQSSKGGGDPGGVIGSIVNKGNKSIGVIEPQSTQTPAQFNKSSKIFNDIMNGKWSNSPTAQKIYQKGIDAGFTGGSGSISHSNIPKQTSVPNASKTLGSFSKFASKYTPTHGHLGTFGGINYESYTPSDLIESTLSNVDEDKIDYMIIHMFSNPEFVERVPELIEALEIEKEIADAYGTLFGFEDEREKPLYNPDQPWGDLEVKETKIRSVRSVIREQAAQAPTVDASSSPGEVNSSIIKNATDNFAKEYVNNHGVEKAQKLKDDTEAFMQEQDIPTNEERATPPEIQDPESNTDEDIWDRLGDIAKDFWKRTNYASLDAKGVGVILDQTQWFVTNIIDFTQRHVVDGVYEEIFGDDLIKTASKLSNNISIARSIMSGKVIEHKPIITEVNKFKESLTLDNFTSKRLKISTSPVPYADDNIYIDENGKTHVNHGEYASLADEQWGFGDMHGDDGLEGSLAASGKGYAQMVIPTDGSEPYVLFEDYNYHNLNSKDSVEVPNPASEILSALSHLIGESGFSSLLTHVFIGHVRNAANNYDRIFDSLKDKQGLPGWPKGIHGAAHTKFQVPLNQLPKETQDMIKNHPLLWPKERVQNLPIEERVPLYRSVDVKDPAVRAYFDESFDRIIKDHPELQENWDASGRAYKQRRELLAKKRVGNDPTTQAKIDAAYKELQDAKWGEDGVRWSSLPEEEQFKMAGVSHKEYTKLREKVQGYRHRFDYANQQVDYLASVAETDKLTQLYTTYNQIQQNAYAPIKGMNDALGVVDGQIKGTEQQRQQYQKLVSDYRKAYEEMMVHFRARQAQMMKTSQIHQNYMNEYDNTWKQASQMFNQVQSTLNSKIDELRRVWEVAKENGIDGINKKLKELEQEIKELGEKNEPLAKAFDDDYLYDFIHWKFGKDYPDVDVDPWTNPRMAATSVDDGYGGSGPAEPLSSPDEPVQDDPTYGGADAATAAVMAGARKKRYEEYKKKYESELLEEDKLHILKEIKKPVEVCEVPFQKLRKYKPNFVGKFTPQNVPSAVASHQSDKLVDRANARGQTWRSENRYWQGYETTERMNLIQDRLGHGNQAWEKIIDEARNKNGWKNREIQEHLNIIAHTKAMKDMNPEYEDPFTYLQLQEMGNAEPAKDPIGDEKRENELDTYLKDPLVKRVAKKVKSTLDYKDKPAKKGYPDKEPPKMEKGWHPQFGKGKEGYYSKLDPQSANAMPPQEDEVIDKQVEKAKTKPELDTIPFRDSLFKKLATLRDKQKKELTNA